MSIRLVHLTPEIREEMRGLKATGMTCPEVAAEIEKRHGLRPSPANTRLICKGIAPQRKGRVQGVAGVPSRRSRGPVDWERLLELAHAEGNSLAEGVIGLARGMRELYVSNLKQVRLELVRFVAKAQKQEQGGAR
jgi:hypothetical protein